MSDFQSRLCALQDKVDRLTEERDRYREAIVQAQRECQFGLVEYADRILTEALRGGEE